MTRLALRVWQLSLTTSLILLPLLVLAGPILRRYASKRCYILWLLLAFRLLLPLELPLLPALLPVELPTLTLIVPKSIGATPPSEMPTLPDAVSQPTSTSFSLSGWELAGWVWFTGMLLVLLVHLVSYLIFRTKLWNQAHVVQTDSQLLAHLGGTCPVLRTHINTPITLGLLHPVIFLPEPVQECHLPLILRHELCHIQRRDLWYKTLFLVCAAVHWFNPLVWRLGTVASQTLELCCDESVVAGKSTEFRRHYGQVLLQSAATTESTRFAAPFSCMDFKERLMNLFTPKKKNGVLLCSVVCIALLLVGFAHHDTTNTTVPEQPVQIPAQIQEPIPNDSLSMLERMLTSPFGTDLPHIDYAGNELLLFHDYWGLAVYDRRTSSIARVADTASLGMNRMQGDRYTQVTMSSDLNTIYLENIPNSDGTVWMYQIQEDQFLPALTTEYTPAHCRTGHEAEQAGAVLGITPNGGQSNLALTPDGHLFYLELPEEGSQTIGQLSLTEIDSSGNTTSHLLEEALQTASHWIWPLEEHYTLSALYGTRVHPVHPHRQHHHDTHNGIDILAPKDTPVLAVADGTVQTEGYDRQLGNYILIAHPDGQTSLYGQLTTSNVQTGDTVTQGQVIGTVGSTGMATGSHLHLEVCNAQGIPIDPLSEYPTLTHCIEHTSSS